MKWDGDELVVSDDDISRLLSLLAILIKNECMNPMETEERDYFFKTLIRDTLRRVSRVLFLREKIDGESTEENTCPDHLETINDLKKLQAEYKI